MDNQLDSMEKKIDGILLALNGPKGVITKVELHERMFVECSKAVDGIPSPTTLKTYAFLGGGVTVVFGIFVVFFNKTFKTGGG